MKLIITLSAILALSRAGQIYHGTTQGDFQNQINQLAVTQHQSVPQQQSVNQHQSVSQQQHAELQYLQSVPQQQSVNQHQSVSQQQHAELQYLQSVPQQQSVNQHQSVPQQHTELQYLQSVPQHLSVNQHQSVSVPQQLYAEPNYQKFHVNSVLNGARILSYQSDKSDYGYEYGFETDNGIRAQEVGQYQGKSHVVQGAYSYTGDDGQVYTVTYTADENGFHPQGAHLPKPPPTPEVIVKSLENNARDEANGMFDDGTYKENPHQYETQQSQDQHQPQPQSQYQPTGGYQSGLSGTYQPTGEQYQNLQYQNTAPSASGHY